MWGLAHAWRLPARAEMRELQRTFEGSHDSRAPFEVADTKLATSLPGLSRVAFQPVLHASLAVGCTAIGVECAFHRHAAAEVLLSVLRQRLSAEASPEAVRGVNRLRNAFLLRGDALKIPLAVLLVITHAFLFDVVRAAPIGTVAASLCASGKLCPLLTRCLSTFLSQPVSGSTRASWSRSLCFSTRATVSGSSSRTSPWSRGRRGASVE